MSIVTILLWSLVLFIGVPMALVSFSLMLVNRNLRELDNLEKTGFVQLRFEQFPWFVRMLLKKHRLAATEVGFTDLALFTRTGYGAPNFSCIMRAPDGLSIAEIEYVRIAPLFLLLLLFVKPHDFFRALFGLHGMVISSVFEDKYRLCTTSYKFLADQTADGREYQIVPHAMPLREKLQNHSDRIQKIHSERKTEPLRFNSTEEYFDFERRILRELAEQGRKEIEQAQSCPLA